MEPKPTAGSRVSPGRTVTRVAETRLRPGMGSGHKVRVVVEPGNWEEHDPFLALMEDWFTPGTFGPHPHRGFETFTYVLEGELRHRDNHGGEGVLQAGDAQLMTAGRGIIHEEEPMSGTVHTLQLWLNLPATEKMTEPRYQDLRGEAMPTRREDGAEIRVFSGHSGDAVAPTLNHVPLTALDLRLPAGVSISQDLSPHDTALIYVIEGKGHFSAARTPASTSQVVWFTPASAETSPAITIEADGYLHAIYFSGRPLREPVAAQGPFVMNTAEQITEAYADYRAGRF